MSAIKSFSSELPIGSEPPKQQNIWPIANGKNIHSYQKLAMKVANIFIQNTNVKSERKGHVESEMDDAKRLFFTELTLPILQMPEWNSASFSCYMRSFKGFVEPEIQRETPLELSDEIELCSQQKTSRDYELFDDEIPLLNMSGALQAANNNIVQKSNWLLMSSVKEDGNSSGQPVISQVDDQIIANSLALKQELKDDVFVKKASKVLEHVHHQGGRTAPALSAMTRQSIGMQGSKPVIEQAKVATVGQKVSANVQPEIMVEDLQADIKFSSLRSPADHDITAKLNPAITQERIIHNLTKSEKNQPFLQENENIEVVNISRNSSVPTEIGAQAQPQIQASVARESSLAVSQVDKWVAHRSAIEDFYIKEALPRTLTYTFHQWKNTPSVTFELATKTEFIATTQSREVQQTLLENKHLLSGEKNIYFRQDQEHGQQHRQQQEQHQQEED
ncbi:TPA: hypothetical protein ACKRTE_002304 [Providencia rettgeri]